MNNTKTSALGWIVAVGLFGILLAGGFQGAEEKTAVVDMRRVMQESELGKKNTASLNAAYTAREGLLNFLATHRVLTAEQAMRLRTLSLKTDITATEKQELDRIKGEVVAAAKNFSDLNQKTAPTDADRTLLQEYNQRRDNVARLLDTWNNEFNRELNSLEQKITQDTISAAKESVRDVAKAQGCSVVFDAQVAIYGANDITDAAVKALNAKK